MEEVWGNKYTKICYTICVSIFQITVVKVLLFTINVSCLLLCITQTFLFIVRFDLDYFIQYAPSYFITSFMLCCSICFPFFIEIVQTGNEEMKSYAIKCNNKDVVEKNKREAIHAMTYMVFSLFFGIVGGISFILPSKYDKHIFYVLHLSEEFFPDFDWIFTIFYKMALLPLSIVTVMSPAHILVYAISVLKNQINILLHFIKHINNNYEETENLDFESQIILKERVRFCVNFHMKICRSTRVILKPTEKYIFPFQFFGVLVILSIVILTFTIDRNILHEWSFRIVSLTVVTVFTVAGLAFYGQTLEDISTDIFDALVGLSWYKWNVDTKKLYLMFLLNSNKPFKLKYSEDVSLNYKMGVELIKSFFTAMSVANSLQQART